MQEITICRIYLFGKDKNKYQITKYVHILLIKNTIEFLGIWEEMYNLEFNSIEFEGIRNEVGLNRLI